MNPSKRPNLLPLPPRLPASALPQFEPDPSLWSRIAAERRRRIAQRRRVGSWAGAAIAAGLALVTLLPHPHQEPAASAWQRRAQTLEAQWLAQTAEDAGATSVRAELRLIDRALQAAYDRGAEREELDGLCQRRSEALRDLIDGPRHAPALTRI